MVANIILCDDGTCEDYGNFICRHPHIHAHYYVCANGSIKICVISLICGFSKTENDFIPSHLDPFFGTFYFLEVKLFGSF